MKRALLISLLAACFLTGHAQWSDTRNQFYDSLDMPVTQVTSDQRNPLVVKSEPDGGYFVIWEDFRNGTGLSNCDIYAQKYDRDGHALWAVNGVPVATGPVPDQQYSNVGTSTFSYPNYNNVSHAATDGNGGFYITWHTYLNAPISSYGVYIQHIRANGTRVFAEDGYPLAIPTTSDRRYNQPQLLADGTGGFFIGYLNTVSGFNGTIAQMDLYAYRDEGGTLKRLGGGNMSTEVNFLSLQNNYRYCAASGIGGYTSNPFATTNAVSFKIFPDLQGGCGVVMILSATGEKNYPAYNQLCKVKRDVTIPTLDNESIFLKKDSLVALYRAFIKYQQIDCSDATGPPGSVVEANVYTVEAAGAHNLLAAKIDAYPYDLTYPGSGAYFSNLLAYGIERVNAAVMPTDGNINALLVTWNQRNYVNSQVTNWSTRGVVLPMEKYESVPHQLLLQYRPAGMHKINQFTDDADTLIAPFRTYQAYDYSLTGSGGRAFMVSSLNGLASSSVASPFYYQEMKLIRPRSDSFALVKATLPTQDTGMVLGIGTANDRFAYFAGDGAGNATFYFTGPNGRDYVKASPVAEGGKLTWGALGLPLNSGGVSGSYYNPTAATMYQEPAGQGVIAWHDSRRTPDGYSGLNVYMRHLDSLDKPGYQPASLNTQLTVVPANPTAAGNRFSQSNPQSLIGTSGAWTSFQVPVSNGSNTFNTPVAAIRDDYNLGTVSVSTYDFYNQPLRRVNGKAYMDRNYTINVTNHPPGASIHVRLVFTKAQFDAMKAAEPSITDPGQLAVIKQPSAGVAPMVYTPSASDEGIRPLGWGTYYNNASEITGYYLEIVITDFSNFFIGSVGTVLPVTLQSFTVKPEGNSALLQWLTASELNNDHFDIERAGDGQVFTKIGRVAGNGTTSTPQDYSFRDAAPLSGNNYYRLAQVDIDGHVEYSQVRLLAFSAVAGKMIVSPNPVKSILNLRLPIAASGQDLLELYNLSGRKVLVQSVPAGVLQVDTDISSLAPGVYVLRFGTTTIKLVKE